MNCIDRMTSEQKRAYIRRNNLIAAVRKAYAKGELSDEAVRKLESEGIELEVKHRGTLMEERPDLLEEWDWEENEKRGLRPNEVSAGSGKIKACWKHWDEELKMWHRWETAIKNRVKGCGCSVCAGKKVLKGSNDLATKMPHIAVQWHPTKNGGRTAQDVGVSSEEPVWWRCPNCGHEWQQYIKARIKQYPKRPCPKCRKESPGFDTVDSTEERPAAQDKPS